MFINEETLKRALESLPYSNANNFLNIWFVLKAMGLKESGDSIEITTASPEDATKHLYGCSEKYENLFVPFGSTKRYRKLKNDMSRSVIQTNIKRWVASKSVVTCDPTAYLDIKEENGKLFVATAKNYPLGLGHGKNGFAQKDNTKVSVPYIAFAIWYGRTTEIPNDKDPSSYLIDNMSRNLNLSEIEIELIFENDDIAIETQNEKIGEETICNMCEEILLKSEDGTMKIDAESIYKHKKRIISMRTNAFDFHWLRKSPESTLKEILDLGEKAIILVGSPRTGKTRCINQLLPSNDDRKTTIQIHDGWGYNDLIIGYRPNETGEWHWEKGPLLEAIIRKDKFIVLEEINRTNFTQALGEVFSLIENAYRGEENYLTLQDGQNIFLSKDTIFIMTMNDIDKSTEDIDDALLGRVASIFFSPRVESLHEILSERKLPAELIEKIKQLFILIQETYPLGHGYFTPLHRGITNQDFILFYTTKIRPVLLNYVGRLRITEINQIDKFVDDQFG